jgi:5-deoxy-D-glucuronate isomerase
MPLARKNHAKTEATELIVFLAGQVILVARGQQSYCLNGMADPQRSWHSHNDPVHEGKLAMQTGCIRFRTLNLKTRNV